MGGLDPERQDGEPMPLSTGLFCESRKEAAMRTMRLLVTILAATALLLPSCRKGTDGVRGVSVRTETVNGVTLVHNPAVPFHPEKSVRFEEEVAFGGEETGPGAVLKPGQYAIDGRNRVYVYESGGGRHQGVRRRRTLRPGTSVGRNRARANSGKFISSASRPWPPPRYRYPEPSDVHFRGRGGLS